MNAIAMSVPRSRVRVARPSRGTAWRRLGIPGWVSLAVIVVTVIVAVAAPLLAPYDSTTGDLSARLLLPGTDGHLLGTDGQGRDILSRLMYGAQPTLIGGLLPVVIGGVGGAALGIIAGLGPKWLNTAIMRTLDVIYAFPAVLLAIAIAAALGPGMWNSIIALSVIFTPSVVRLTETEVARMRGADYMEAARTSGARSIAIALRQVVPVIAPPLIVYLTAGVGLTIVYAAGLSYLGLGVTPPQAEWGVMVNELQQYLFNAPALLLAPALAILFISIAFNVLGDSLQRVLNARISES
jgi:peptide/nickel transport system permease protein